MYYLLTFAIAYCLAWYIHGGGSQSNRRFTRFVDRWKERP